MQPQFPLYIPSKGRYRFMMTSKTLTEIGVAHSVVVEPQEVDAYRSAVRDLNLSATIIELDLGYKQRYELCDEHGLSRSTGSGPARNFIWDHSIAAGYPWHWIMDDNIGAFYRLNRNLKIKVADPTIFRCMEDFTLRYVNVAMAGPNYHFFTPRKRHWPVFKLNTRIYSCNLIRNDLPFRWRGRYNEDVILSLDLLKAGWCTIQFNAFLQGKMATQSMPGGNTAELYQNGTLDKSRMIARVHPDVSRIAKRYNRIHHYVNYEPFERMRLLPRPDLDLAKGVDNYGMTLRVVA